MTAVRSEWEVAADLFERPKPKWPSPGRMAVELDPNTRQTPALDLIDAALKELVETPDGRLIISMPPQEGKSERVTRRFPTWVLQHRPDISVVIASYEQNIARRWGRAIRDDIIQNPTTLGLAIRSDLSGQSEWQLLGHDGGVVSVGIGGALTGRKAGLLVIDDPIKDRQQADSLAYRDKVWSWWTDVASTRLAPGGQVVLVLTRWHEDDLAARLLAGEDGDRWKVVNIPAQAFEQPDPLTRKIGEFMQSARRRTVEQWRKIKVQVGSRSWAALYQGTPAPVEGDILKRGWWRRYDEELWIMPKPGVCMVPEAEEIIQSWDMAFKGEDDSDFVVGQVWMRKGVDAYLLDQVRGQMDFVETCKAVEALSVKWPQSVLKLVEDKANGPAVMAQLRRTVPGMVPEEPNGSKTSRANAIAPLVEAGNVWLPSSKIHGCEWVDALIIEASGFPNAANDDQVDAATQAINRLILQPFIDSTETWDMDEIDADIAGTGISPY